MKEQKTIVEKLLDQKKIKHQSYTFDVSEAVDGVTAANMINKPAEQVFKTLVTVGNKGNCVFVVPVAEELDLKKRAKASGQKYVEMIKQKDLLRLTGYVHGGCSPIAMKKLFPTYLHSSCKNFDTIIFSAGRIGKQVEMSPGDLVKLTIAKIEDIIQEH